VRIILYTGKGGVGKTTIAAASALRAAELGYKTIVLSTDSAHSLSDSFDMSLGDEPQLIVPNLWGQETSMSQTLRAHWGTVQKWMASLLAWRGMDEVIADEMAILPGMEELANLLYIVNYHDAGEYDVVIVDCAPTGETLRLLSFPEVLQWWMHRIFPVQRSVAHVLRPLIKFASDIPMPGEEVFASVEQLISELIRVQDLFADPEKTSVRLVVNPEKMVIKEAQRTFTYLNLYGYYTDLVICNRLISEGVKDPYFDYWKRCQAEYYRLIEECFSPVPILSLPLFEREIVGIPMLQTVGRALYQNKNDDPVKVFFRGEVQNIERENGNYILNLSLPFISKGDIALMRNNDELAIQVGNFRRNIVLPSILRELSVTGAKFEGDKLRVKFVKEQSNKSNEQ